MARVLWLVYDGIVCLLAHSCTQIQPVPGSLPHTTADYCCSSRLLQQAHLQRHPLTQPTCTDHPSSHKLQHEPQKAHHTTRSHRHPSHRPLHLSQPLTTAHCSLLTTTYLRLACHSTAPCRHMHLSSLHMPALTQRLCSTARLSSQPSPGPGQLLPLPHHMVQPLLHHAF
jgi:hypothetical protein